MRLSLILTAALTAVVLSGCDQLPRIALLPPKSGDCCQCATTAKSACPAATAAAPAAVPAAKIPAEPVMEAEAAPATPAPRRHLVRAHTQARVHTRTEAQTLAYAGGPAPAPAFDGQVYVPEAHAYARVDAQETRTEHYSERQESYGYVQGGHAQSGYVQNGYAQGGYAQGGPPRGPCPCGPTPAAGRDRDGFLTWPGKLAQRP